MKNVNNSRQSNDKGRCANLLCKIVQTKKNEGREEINIPFKSIDFLIIKIERKYESSK